MRLVSTQVAQQSDGNNRLSGEVRYADGTTDTYWFDLPTGWEPTNSGNPWVACLLPLAVTLGEDIEISLPVDGELLDSTAGLMRLWKSWFPSLSMVSVRPDAVAPIEGTPREAMAFFSAGVDSYYTVLRHPVKRLVNILGLDMPITKKWAFQKHCERLSSIARNLGAELVPIRTNIRQTRWKTCHWELLGHGAALAAVALVMENRFSKVWIAASYDYGTLHPWGSHPLSDPLFSTSKTQIIHDGATHTRVEKTESIVQSELVMQTLHVCFRGLDALGQDDTNCGECSKCYRTMAVLDILGQLDKCALFDRKMFDVRKISRMLVETTGDKIFSAEITELAEKWAEMTSSGKSNVACAVRSGFRDGSS